MAGLNTSVVFPNGIRKAFSGLINWTADTIKACLVRASFANTTLTEANKDAFDFLDDVPVGDRSDGQFIAITTNDIQKDDTNDKLYFGAGTTGSIVFLTVGNGISCRGIVVFKSSGTAAASPLISYNHFASNVVADGGNVEVTLNTNGVFQASYV